MPNLHKPKALIFGIDGGDPRIVDFGIRNGFLPNLAAIAEKGVFNTLKCTWPPHTSTGWTSMFSGRLPGDHRIFQFWDCQDRDYRLKPMLSTEVNCPLLWDYFQQLGWSVGLVNVPMSHPPQSWKGFQITWPLEKTLHYCQPPQLVNELRKIGGLHLPDIAYMYNGEVDYPEKAIDLIRRRTIGVEYLIKQYSVDVLAVVYPEADRVSHHYWPELDECHPRHVIAAREGKQTILEVYKALDQALGNLLQAVGEDCVVMIVSDHGFGPGTKGLRLHKLLEEAGFSTFQNDRLSAGNQLGLTEISSKFNVLERLDKQKSMAYMPTPGCFGLNMNIRGRQSAGLVNMADVSLLQADLIQFLEGLTDATQDSKVFKKVLLSQDCFSGPFRTSAPDLIMIPTDPALMILNGVDGPIWDDPPQVGLHRMEGMFLLKTPNESPLLQEVEVNRIEQVAATLLQALNLPTSLFNKEVGDIPAIKILRDSWSSAEDPSLELNESIFDDNRASYSSNKNWDFSIPKDNEKVLDRLRGLGYID